MSLTELNRTTTLSIVYQAVDSLKPRSTNPRTHSKKQIGQIASAIRRFGFTNPMLVDDANGIVAGHGRVEAAKAVGLDQVPTVRLSAMSEAEIRAYVIADNRLAPRRGFYERRGCNGPLGSTSAKYCPVASRTASKPHTACSLRIVTSQ